MASIKAEVRIQSEQGSILSLVNEHPSVFHVALRSSSDGDVVGVRYYWQGDAPLDSISDAGDKLPLNRVSSMAQRNEAYSRQIDQGWIPPAEHSLGCHFPEYRSLDDSGAKAVSLDNFMGRCVI